MLMMVTSRRLRNGTYLDQEQANYGYHYLSGHSSHRYHPGILEDVVHVLSSVERTLIPTRREAPKLPDRPDLPPNHFELG